MKKVLFILLCLAFPLYSFSDNKTEKKGKIPVKIIPSFTTKFIFKVDGDTLYVKMQCQNAACKKQYRKRKNKKHEEFLLKAASSRVWALSKGGVAHINFGKRKKIVLTHFLTLSHRVLHKTTGRDVIFLGVECEPKVNVSGITIKNE